MKILPTYLAEGAFRLVLAATWILGDNETKLVWDSADESTLIELAATTLNFQATFVEEVFLIRR